MTRVIAGHAFMVTSIYHSTLPGAPTFGLTTIGTTTTCTLQFKSHQHPLQPGSDHIVFEFPSTWTVPTFGACACCFPTGSCTYSNACDSYQDSKRVIIYLRANVPANTLVTGTITMPTPGFKYLTPPVGNNVRVIVFFRTRLEDIWTMAAFSQVLTQKTITPITVTSTSAIVSDIGEY
jgi:hypothetical protein